MRSFQPVTVGGKRPRPVILQRLRLVQVVRDFLFQLRLRHHLVERRFGISVLFRPDPVTPVNVFDRTLIGHAFGETERFGLTRRARPFAGEARGYKH